MAHSCTPGCDASSPQAPHGDPTAPPRRWQACSDDELVVAFDQLSGVARATTAQLVLLAGEVARRGLPAIDGCVDLTSWLVARTGEERRWAASVSRVSQACGEDSPLAAAMAEGHLGLAHGDAVIRICAARPDLEIAAVVADACGRNADQLELAARQAVRVSREQDEQALARRSLRWWGSPHAGMVHLSGELRADDAATLTDVITRLADQAGKDPSTDTYESFEARCADALVELASGWGPKDLPSPSLAVLHVPIEAIEARGTASTADGEPLSTDTLLRILCDCRWQVVADGAGGTSLGVGRASRVVPGWLRRVVRWRDQTCRFPGCARRHWIDVHHLVHWAHGGPTDAANLLSLCGYHHRLIHNGGWHVQGDPDTEIRFSAPSGRLYSSRAAPIHPDLRARCRTNLWPSPAGSEPPLAHQPGPALAEQPCAPASPTHTC